MSYSQELIDELEILSLFDLRSTQQGIKVHSNASPHAIAATERLYQKGFITLKDGGYLTDLGYEAVGHAQSLFSVLDSRSG